MLAAFLPREDARDAFISRKAKTLARSAGRRGGRHRLAAAPGDGPTRAAGPRGGAVARQCRNAAAQARGRRGRCDAARRRRAEAARPPRGRDRDARHRANFCPPSARARSASRPARTTPQRARWSPTIDRSRHARRRWRPSAPSSQCSTAPAARRSAAMPRSAATRISFRGIIVKPDGSEAFEVSREGRREDAAALGADAGRELKARGGPDFFARALSVRLLVTRPRPEAERTAAILRAHGHDVVIAPLLRIEAVTDAEIGAGPWAAILVTSANAAPAIAAHRRFPMIAHLARFCRRPAQRRGHAGRGLRRGDLGRRRCRRSRAACRGAPAPRCGAPLPCRRRARRRPCRRSCRPRLRRRDRRGLSRRRRHRFCRPTQLEAITQRHRRRVALLAPQRRGLCRGRPRRQPRCRGAW